MAGDTLAAIGTLQKLSNAFSADCDALVLLSELLYQTGSLEQAIFTANLGLKSLEDRKCEKQVFLGAKQRAHALYILARISKERRQNDQALARMNESLALIMDFDRLFDRFLLLLHMNRMKDALQDLRKLRDANYERAATYYADYLK